MERTHRHERDDWEGYMDVQCTDIAPNVCIQPMGRHGKPEGYISGFIIAHDVDGEPFRCEGLVNIDPDLEKGGESWTMTGSLDGGDLTLAPSVQCTTHPEFHAHVQNGRWTG